MIKKLSVFLLYFLLVVMPLTSAQPLDLFQFKGAFYDVLGFFFGAVDSGELLVIKFLVFILLLVMVKYALSKIPAFEGNKNIIAIISIVVALISIRYITSDALVNMIWLPYGVLGVALSSILPLIIFFYFIESIDSSTIRKVGWISFTVIYAALAILRWGDFLTGVEWWQNLAWFYLIIAVISLIILIFEKQIRMNVVLGMIRRGEDTHSLVLKSELQEDLRRINRALANPSLSKRESSRLDEEKKRIEKAIARIN